MKFVDYLKAKYVFETSIQFNKTLFKKKLYLKFNLTNC